MAREHLAQEKINREENLAFAAVGGTVVRRAGLVQAKEEAPIAGAQNGSKPVIVISLSGYGKVLEDVGFVGRLAQQPGLQQQVEAMVTLFTQGQGLNGLDKKRPWGVVLNSVNGDFQPIGFLPVTDMKALLDSLAQWTGPAEPSNAGKGLLEVQKPNQRWFLKEQQGWVFISPKADNLADMPADPTKLARRPGQAI